MQTNKTIYLDLGEESVKVEFTRNTTFIKGDYGTDADGRRGELRTFIDEDNFDNVIVEGTPLEKWGYKFQEYIVDRLQSWMNRHSPEYEEEMQEFVPGDDD